MIYDKVLTDYGVGLTTSPIYTLVWDNYDPEKKASEQSDVYVGIELLNEGDDFWGEMNLVRKNGVFYLLGKLDLSDALEAARQGSSEAFSNLDLNVQIEQDTRGERTCCFFSAEEESLNFSQRNSLDFCNPLWYMLLLQRGCADGTNQY